MISLLLILTSLSLTEIRDDKYFSLNKLESFKRKFAESVGEIQLAAKDFCIWWSFKSVFLAAELQVLQTPEFTFLTKQLLQFFDHKYFNQSCFIVFASAKNFAISCVSIMLLLRFVDQSKFSYLCQGFFFCQLL